MQFIDERNGKLIDELGKMARTDAVHVGNYRMVCTGQTWRDADSIEEGEWKEFPPGGIWGGDNVFNWFCTDIVIPEEFAVACVVYGLETGREGSWDATNPQLCVYIDGELKQGLDVNHREVVLTESARPGQVYRLRLSAFTGNRNFNLVLQSAVKVLHRETENLYYDLEVPRRVLELLEPESGDAVVIRKALTETLNLLDFRRPFSCPASLSSINI